MTATFIERALSQGDYQSDGGAIDPVYMLKPALDAIESGLETRANFKYYWNLTTPQATEFDEVCDTMPATLTILSTVLNANSRATWAARTASLFALGSPNGNAYYNFNTPAKIRVALGLD